MISRSGHPARHVVGAAVDLLAAFDNDVFVSGASIWKSRSNGSVALAAACSAPANGRDRPFRATRFLAFAPEHAGGRDAADASWRSIRPVAHRAGADQPMRLVTSDAQVWRYGEMILRAGAAAARVHHHQVVARQFRRELPSPWRARAPAPSAGMMPSSCEQSWKASSASLSVADR